MGLVTSFEHDIFISYAHIDDAPLMTGEEGWVSKFHQSLEVLRRCARDLAGSEARR